MASRRSRSLLLVTALATLVFVAAAPVTAEAQRRYRRVAPVVVIGGFGYYSYWRHDPWYRWGQYRYPYRYYGVYDALASLRIDAEPRQAQVFVDGYYAGLVDDFDGVFQRLRLEPGGRTITLYLEGYRTEEHRLYLRPGHDQRLRITMVPLASGERSEPPVPSEWDDEEAGEPGVPPRAEAQPRRSGAPVRSAPARFGTLALRVQPSDAEVFIDGERWEAAADQGLFRIELPEGRHRVEVRRNGANTYTEDVLIRRDRTLTLNVSLK